MAISGPVFVAVTGMLAASLLGILSGYLGGSVDMVIQRFVDFMFALPGLLIAIVIVGVTGGGYWMAVFVLALWFIIAAMAFIGRILPEESRETPDPINRSSMMIEVVEQAVHV